MGLLDFLSKKPERSGDAWPFEDATNTAVFTNKHVLNGKLITAVYHDPDGEWQFHTNDADSNSSEGIKIVCLKDIYDRDRSVGELASMPPGHKATRGSVRSAWVIEKYESSDED